jgi:hypothetical protein
MFLYILLSGGVSISAFLPLFLPFLSTFGELNSGLENKLAGYDNYGDMISLSIFDIPIYIFMTITIIFSFLKRKKAYFPYYFPFYLILNFSAYKYYRPL